MPVESPLYGAAISVMGYMALGLAFLMLAGAVYPPLAKLKKAWSGGAQPTLTNHSTLQQTTVLPTDPGQLNRLAVETYRNSLQSVLAVYGLSMPRGTPREVLADVTRQIPWAISDRLRSMLNYYEFARFSGRGLSPESVKQHIEFGREVQERSAQVR